MMKNYIFYIAIFFLVIFGLLLIGLLFMLLGIRSSIDSEIPNTNESGGWFGGVFLMQPLIHISLKTENSKLKTLEKKHNKIINYFWLNLLNLLMGIILLNISE